MISSKKFKCENTTNGCVEILLYENLIEHMDICKFRII